MTNTLLQLNGFFSSTEFSKKDLVCSSYERDCALHFISVYFVASWIFVAPEVDFSFQSSS